MKEQVSACCYILTWSALLGTSSEQSLIGSVTRPVIRNVITHMMTHAPVWFSVYKHIEAGTKWQTFCKQHIQMYFVTQIKMVKVFMWVQLTMSLFVQELFSSRFMKKTITWAKDDPIPWAAMGLLPDMSSCWLRMSRYCLESFPRQRWLPLVSDPGMHHGTCRDACRDR